LPDFDRCPKEALVVSKCYECILKATMWGRPGNDAT